MPIKTKITYKELETDVLESITKALVLVEAGGTMSNNEAKRMLRFAVQKNAINDVMAKVAKHIDFTSDDTTIEETH